VAFVLLGVFAGLKIAYGASTGRTIGLVVVALLIMVTMGHLARAILHVG
jgi:hypothetical protein